MCAHTCSKIKSALLQEQKATHSRKFGGFKEISRNKVSHFVVFRHMTLMMAKQGQLLACGKISCNHMGTDCYLMTANYFHLLHISGCAVYKYFQWFSFPL
jgi:hypothetical protein